MLRVLIILALLLQPPARAADEGLTLDLDVARRGERHHIVIVPAGEGVEVRYDLERSGKKVSHEGRFGPGVRESLLKAWGAATFSIAAWPSEGDCLTADLRFVASSGGESRLVCRDRARVRKLLDFKGAVTFLLQE